VVGGCSLVRGGANRQSTRKSVFAPAKESPAPVTATLDFSLQTDYVTLSTSSSGPNAADRRFSWKGKFRPLRVRHFFSPPIASFFTKPPAPKSCLLEEEWGNTIPFIRGRRRDFIFFQPYEIPDRIPVVFVHGHISNSFDGCRTNSTGLQQIPERDTQTLPNSGGSFCLSAR